MRRRNFEILVRAVILHRGKILLCWLKDFSFYFLPGGHVESGESVRRALTRELREELRASVRSQKVIGVVENIWKDGRKKRHELNVVSLVKINRHDATTPLRHIEFHWIEVAKLARKRVLPYALKKSIQRWLKDRKFFWAWQR
ncbi:MAG: NUDIX domain-containing protein [Candidatus Sungbacteria bacterium]|uniref:NUDIX domain-containing protein n=1 Tax=Candidatus Sungiibacteriota bacterium TaxID=2750080 RepID=A0A933DRL4_9BACT|nr:NUDIX domain-containing protein [Candidatus Sungbacteria bacterium]